MRGSGRPRVTIEPQDRRFILLALRDMTPVIADAFFADEGKSIGIRSDYLRIRSFGLRIYSPFWN